MVYIGLAIISLSFPFFLQAQTNLNADVEGKVRSGLSDMPVMIGVAQCESGFRQFNSNGTVLRGSGRYVGIFQIDEQIHRARAATMAYDIYTVDGNIAYTRYLYSMSGSSPWKGCVKTDIVPPAPAVLNGPTPVTSAEATLTITLKSGMNHPEVLSLQKILNVKGFAVSASGPGSKGSETSYFGSLTRKAVMLFQCSQAIVCGGSESLNGYGLVGPKTRSALNRF